MVTGGVVSANRPFVLFRLACQSGPDHPIPAVIGTVSTQPLHDSYRTVCFNKSHYSAKIRAMWNDTNIPLAYLITIRTRGTWLHGTEKGSVNRENNIYRTPILPSNDGWEKYNLKKLKGEPLLLRKEQRALVHEAVKDTCRIRNWDCFAVNVRTNHAHAVVAGGNADASKVLHALKANATRTLRERSLWPYEYSPWADKGSQRYLWTEQSVTNAINYVLYSQGDDFLYTE